MSEPARHLMPAIETMEQHWVSWDEPLDPIDVFTGPFVKESCFGIWQMYRSW